MVEQQQTKALDVTNSAPPGVAGGASAPEDRGWPASTILLLLSALLLVFGLAIVVLHLVTRRRAGVSTAQPTLAKQDLERVFVGRSGDLGFLLRGSGAADSAAFMRTSEARALALAAGEIVARLDTVNFSDKPVAVAQGEWWIRIGEERLRPVQKPQQEAASEPLRAALSGGDPAAPLAGRSARRLGWLGTAAGFDRETIAQIERGDGPVVALRAATVTERELAEFDRAPEPATLERWAARAKP